MTHSPHQIAELARAALAWDCTPTNPPSHAEEQFWKFRAATHNPLIWLALVERLRDVCETLDKCCVSGDYYKDTMANKPLDAPPENAQR